MKPFLLILPVALVFTANMPLYAERASDRPVYELEVIVFKRNAQDAGSTEFWPRISSLPDLSTAIQLSNPATEAAPKTAVDPTLAGEVQSNTLWQLLSSDSHKLNREYQRLEATRGRLQPIIHQAWRQPVQSKRLSRPIYISDRPGTRPPSVSTDRLSSVFTDTQPPELLGTLLLSSHRYLHVDLDLMLYDPSQGAPIPAPLENTAAPEATETAVTTREPVYPGYRLRDHRRMRSGELHYIDHPMMGVLILATPYKQPLQHTPAIPAAKTVDTNETGQTTPSAPIGIKPDSAQEKPGIN